MKDGFAYVACGCIRTIVSDEPTNRKFTANLVRHMIMDGLAIERVLDAYVREHGFESCEQCDPMEQTSMPGM